MDVMMNMTTEDVRVLREHFATSLTLDQFVPLLKKTLHDRIHDEMDFVIGVIDLFHTIDVNGDGTLDWDEFARYMLDAGQAKADFTLDDGDHSSKGAHEGTTQHKHYQLLKLAPRDAKTPMANVQTYVQQALLLSDLNALAYFEYDADVVYIYTVHFDRNEAPRYRSTIRLHTAFQEHVIIGMEYVPGNHWLVISSMRAPLAYLSVWNVADPHSPAMLHRAESRAPLEQLCWLSSLQCLVSSAVVFPSIQVKQQRGGYRPNALNPTYTKINQLLLWDLNTMVSKPAEFRMKDRLKGVSAIASFKCYNRLHLALGLEVGVILIIDAEKAEELCSFDAHANGVKALAYSPQVDCLASIGDYSYSDETTLHVAVWRKTSNKLVLDTMLTQHEAPLQALVFMDCKRQLITCDVSGVYLVFSSVVRTPTSEPWECLQRFHVTVPVPPFKVTTATWCCCLLTVQETAFSDPVLISTSTQVTFHDFCEVKEREEIFYAVYSHPLQLIVGTTVSKILLWNAESGLLYKSYEYNLIMAPSTESNNLPSSSNQTRATITGDHTRLMTAICMDDLERKLIVGDDMGCIKVINAMNGNWMKDLDPHRHPVISIGYVLHGKRVISLSTDSVLHIYDENSAIGYYVPFGGGPPQSVILQSLHFFSKLANTKLNASLHSRGLHRDHQDIHHEEPVRQKFEILKSIGNQKLNLVAAIIAGSHGENFIQLWNFDMSHSQGTCIAPDNTEITSISFFGSSAEIVGGTASGDVFLWSLEEDGSSYWRCLQLVQLSSAFITEPMVFSSILHIVTLYAEKRLHDTSKDTHGASEVVTLFPKSHSIDDRIQREAEGLHVFTGDEHGFVTVWYVQRKSLKSFIELAAVVAGKAKDDPGASRNNGGAIQHQEMVLGYDAVSALYEHAIRHELHRQRQLASSSATMAIELECIEIPSSYHWKAHSSRIVSLTIAKDSQAVITSSTSGKIKCWSLKGELLGILDPFSTRRAPVTYPWRLPVDVDEQRRRKETDAQRFLDKPRNGTMTKRTHPRSMSVLQKRLSLTLEQMTLHRRDHDEDKVQTRQRRTLLPPRSSDVGRAIRKFILSQSTPNTSSTLEQKPDPDLSLHQLLNDVDQLQLSARPWSGGTSSSSRRKYPLVTISNVKGALISRSSSVHCDLPQLSTKPTTDGSKETEHRKQVRSLNNKDLKPAKRQEIVVRSSSNAASGKGKKVLVLSDLRDEVSTADPSQSSNQGVNSRNQGVNSRGQKTINSSKDPVLNYHVRLAHSWQHYQVD